MHLRLRVTVISDDGWCWVLSWRQLGALIVYCLPLKDIVSVQLGSLYNYVGELQPIHQVQDLNELISGHVLNISDIWISFFTKIDILITTRLVFSTCCATLNNTFIIFHSKVWLSLFHQELIHQGLVGLTLACIHIIWVGHGLPRNFIPWLRNLNSRSLTNFLDPVALFSK